MIKLADILNEILEEKLCPKGKAYAERRKEAGEVHSAYLMARASKVCKGTMNEEEELIKCKKCGWEWNLKDGGNDPYICHKCGYDNFNTYNPVDESLRDWFKEKWVRIDTQGEIAGPCGSMKKGKPTTRCLPHAKAQSLSQAERKATVAKKVAGGKKGKQYVKNTKKAEYKK